MAKAADEKKTAASKTAPKRKTKSEREKELDKMVRGFKPYYVDVTGEYISTISGSRPEDTAKLISKPSKTVNEELHKIMKAQVELCLQKGDIEGATAAVDAFQNSGNDFSNPLHVFQRDEQCGRRPFQGAYMFFGAFRDTIKMAYPKDFNIYIKVKNTSGPSIKHLRKSVRVAPDHIFLMKDEDNYMEESDIVIENQHPVPPDVKGFSRFEILPKGAIVKYRLEVHSCTQFNALADLELVKKVIIQSALHGIGSRRASGYGQWKVKKIEFHEMAAMEGSDGQKEDEDVSKAA